MERAGEAVGASAAAPTRPSLKALVTRGALWTVAGYGASQVLRLGSNLVLTRLLFPEAFGLMALVGVFLQGLEMFSDIGVGPSIIQNQRGDDRRFLNTAWTLQLIRGVAISIVALLVAGPLASFYQMPELAWLLPVAGLSSLAAGLNSTGIFSANRSLSLGRLTLLELVSRALGIGVMLVWALVAPSVWALVIGGLVGAVAKAGLSHVWFGGPVNRIAWDAEAWRELMRFGRWIFLATAVHFVAGQVDRLMLGHYLTAAMLGVYSIAFLISDAAYQVISMLSHRVLFPSFSAVARDDLPRLADVYYRARLRTDTLMLTGAGVLLAAGQQVVGVLYDERYAAAGWMLQLLALRVAAGATLTPGAMLLSARGFPRYAFWGSTGRALVLLVGIPAGWYLGGLPATVAVIALADVGMLPPVWLGLRRFGLLRPLAELRALGILGIGGLLGLLVARQVSGLLGGA